MLPSEFYGLYGQPVVKTYQLVQNVVVQIPADEHRYIIGICFCEGGILFSPLVPVAENPTTPNYTTSDGIVIFTHALHGAMVNLPWQMVNLTSATPLRTALIIGRMGGAKPNRCRRKNG